VGRGHWWSTTPSLLKSGVTALFSITCTDISMANEAEFPKFAKI
jgi:hypothetical protein